MSHYLGIHDVNKVELETNRDLESSLLTKIVIHHTITDHRTGTPVPSTTEISLFHPADLDLFVDRRQQWPQR